MKKYILIQNEGEIESNSFELIGASTKRGETGKIGFFGSGLKYSIAYMMRNGIDFKVFSGEQELSFTTIPETLKGQSFDRICINGKPTSYTVTMGPTWKEDWFILREIYCNAIDENSCQLVKELESARPSAGKTRIFIELTDSLKRVIRNWDAYFADERTPLFETPEVYTCALGTEDGIAYIMRQKMQVYKKTEGVLYRRGIRVYKNDDLMYDYSCNHVNINEDRTARNATSLSYGIAEAIATLCDKNYVKSILRTSQNDKTVEEYRAIEIHDAENFSDKWVDFSKENLLVVKDISAKFTEEITMSKKEVFLIPSNFARAIKKNVPDAVILGMGSTIGDLFATEIEKTAKMDYLIKKVLESLKEMQYEVPFDISVVIFDNDAILGKADIKKKQIFLADKVFDMGRREIALTIMEECEHIKSGEGDETRAFQTHLFSQWLKTMENSNGLFL